MLKNFIEMYKKYIIWIIIACVIIASIIYNLISLDLDAMYYAELLDPVCRLHDWSQRFSLDLLNLKSYIERVIKR